MDTEPLAGRSARFHVAVRPTAIEPGALVAEVADPGAGATVLFLGTVRDHSAGKPNVTHLEYEAYAGVVEDKITAICAEAAARWPIIAAAAEHRVGGLAVGEVSVGVAVSAGHRDAAFAAGRYLIDELKARAPIWKKEHWEGGAEWVREDREHPRE